MATADQRRDEIGKAQVEFRAALHAAAGKWLQRAGSSESEWSPRRVAEHVAENELWYASEIDKACGRPGLDIEEFAFATIDEAVAAFDEAAAKAHSRLECVSDPE